VTAGLLASIPSPSSPVLEIGPISLRMYGLMIALGVLVALEMARRRFAARGLDPDDMSAIALWGVPAGLVGARLYHVATDWRRFQGEWLDVFKIWEGGLGIPGGMLLGIVVAIHVARRRGVDVALGLDCAVPSLPLAQAIGRLGNWFNQELFGEPTDLPWGLEIDADRRAQGFERHDTFHPTFLYESLWNLALVGVLLWIDRRGFLKRGRLVWAYVLGYGLGRLWIESLRIDPASELAGLRVNIWVSGVLIAAGIVGIAWGGLARDDPVPDAEERA